MSIRQRLSTLLRAVPRPVRDLIITVSFLAGAYLVSVVLLHFTGDEDNSALVFVLAVVCVSFFTTGYRYGIAASIAGAFCINYFFMYPYFAFNLTISGYPVAFLSMATISCIVSTLTARVKQQAVEAVRRELRTRALYAQNERLNAEKAAIQLQSARESIRAGILRAVSHDLRTPLTSISGAASVLLSSAEISEKNLSLLQDIKSDADDLILMVENLLSVPRIQDDGTPLKAQEDMLEEVAGDAILTIHRRFPDYNVELELPEEILYLPMDATLIKQVIVNLLENAIRHSGDQEHIRLRLFRQEGWAVAEVRDRGIGLSPEICQAILAGRPLDRDRSGDSTRGMGIGLSACQSIIKAHGGFFSAGNDPEGGAVFRFGLPMEGTRHE